MGKGKLTSLEVFLEMNLCEAKVVRYNGIVWPYMINNSGTIWTTPFMEVRPFLDSKSGYLTVNLESNEASCTVPLHILMAAMYIPNDNGFTDARLKSGSKSDPASYIKDNIEWCEGENSGDTSESQLSELDLATIVWCRMRQAYNDMSIANELGITVDTVKTLIKKYDQQFIDDFQFKNNPVSTRKHKVKTIKPFFVYLINLGKPTNDIIPEVRIIIPEATKENASDVIRYIRRTAPGVKPEYRAK